VSTGSGETAIRRPHQVRYRAVSAQGITGTAATLFIGEPSTSLLE
jgi:hypothetical protein